MSLVPGVLRLNATGRIIAAVGGTVTAFNGGTPIDSTGALAVSAGVAPPPPPWSSGGLWETAPSGGTVRGNALTQTAAGAEVNALSKSALPSSGLWYWEIVITKVTNPSGDGAGIAKGKPMHTAPNKGAGGRGNGSLDLLAPGVTNATQVNWGGAGTLMFAYDATTGKLWMGKDGAWFSSGDPAAGTNPYFANIPADTYYIGVTGATGATGSYTLQSAENGTTYTAPAGYSYLTTFNPAVLCDVVISLKRVMAGAVSCLRVRRSSDNATQEIGFTVGGDVDSAAIAAFCGAANGFLEVWHDQSASGAGYIANLTAGQQPLIYTGGAFLGCVRFQGTGAADWDFTQATWNMHLASAATILANINANASPPNNNIMFEHENGASTQNVFTIEEITTNGWRTTITGGSFAASNVQTTWAFEGTGFRGRGWRLNHAPASAAAAADMFSDGAKLAQASAVLTGTLPVGVWRNAFTYQGARATAVQLGGFKEFKNMYVKRALWSDAQMIAASSFMTAEVVAT